ncbi:uncharacterized protein VP01_13875g1 [Puccinia sorghi]|uniref:Electron transfer flavoprotein beta subunit n=1 Tax=Puccinia sorghi TaxID=27349 RepID=A0A0L6VLU3_9BASI|nr:uncharacterized protein VP01_13875g1 [Puccinia sorghi]
MRKVAPPTQNVWPCANALDEKYHHAELHPLANVNPDPIICVKQFIDGCPSQVRGMLPAEQQGIDTKPTRKVLKVEEPQARKAGQIFDNVDAVVAKLKEIRAK